MSSWPTQTEVLGNKSVYGDPRSPRDRTKSSAKWERDNLVYVVPPFPMTYAGVKLKRGFRMHRHCAPSMERVLANLMDAANGDLKTLKHWGVTIFGGAMNFRLMRGGNRLSMHSYGCAIDLDPARNGMYDRTPRFAEFPLVLEAFRAEGWRWGGDWNGNGSSADERLADGMHWQATQ
jgi:hypothetical protein